MNLEKVVKRVALRMQLQLGTKFQKIKDALIHFNEIRDDLI